MEKKYFSLKEARLLLPVVRSITHEYYQKILQIQQRAHSEQIQISNLTEEWALKVFALGPYVKGSWLVDFDSGDGFFYCWQYNEKDILFFHEYQAGFLGRRPVSLLE